MDLIDRQAAIQAVMDLPDCPNGYSDTYDKACIVGMLEEVPSIDAVEVVRCKDCKYFDSGTDEDGKLFFKCLGWVYGGTSEDDFCSHGDRKGDGHI